MAIPHGLFLALCFSFGAQHLFAQAVTAPKGKLPRGPAAVATAQPTAAPGKPAKPEVPSDTAVKVSASPSPAATAQPDIARDETDCFTYLASPTNARVFADRSSIYYLSRVEALPLKNGIDSFRYELSQLTFVREKTGKLATKDVVEKFFSFEGPSFVGLVVHNSPANGYSILSFSGVDTGCALGEAVGVTIPFSQTQIRQLPPSKSIPKGHYALVDSDKGRFYVDMAKGLIKTVDPQSAQQRIIYQSEKMTRPLFWSADKKMAYLWQSLPQPMLLRRGSVITMKLGDLPLKRGERLVQDRDKFGVVRFNVSDNTLGIAELNQWGTAGASVLHVLNLPRGTLADDANVLVSFAGQHAVVYGGTPKAKESWDHLYIYKLKEGLVADLSWTHAERLNAVTFGPKGETLVVFLENRATGLHSSIRVYDVKTRAWMKL